MTLQCFLISILQPGSLIRDFFITKSFFITHTFEHYHVTANDVMRITHKGFDIETRLTRLTGTFMKIASSGYYAAD